MHFQNDRPSLLDFLYRDVRRTAGNARSAPAQANVFKKAFPFRKPSLRGRTLIRL